LWTLVRLVQVKPQTPLLNQENDANNEAGKSGEQPTAPKNTKPGSDSKPNPRPEDGPPDLDELWNDFNRKLGSLLAIKIKNLQIIQIHPKGRIKIFLALNQSIKIIRITIRKILVIKPKIGLNAI